MTYFFVFDTETCYNNIVQLCWYVMDKQYNVVEKHNHYVKPVGFRINNSDIHGITHDYAVSKGVSLIVAIMDFQRSLEKYKPTFLVAHNIVYDIRILNVAYDKLKMDKTLLSNTQLYCTMKKAKQMMNLKNIKGGIKPPKLIECYNYLNHRELNTPIESAHNAFYDVLYTCDVFQKLHLMENICLELNKL